MQSPNNYNVNQTGYHEVLARLNFLPTFFSFESTKEWSGWYVKKTDLSEMLLEQAD